jgi:phosphoribosylaminoimidazole (AIR) synthetase
MGIGLVLIVDHNRINEVLNALKETFTLDAYLIGSIEKGGPLTYIDGISAHGGELV